MYICKKAVNVNGRITEFILLFHNLKYELRLTAYAETKLSQINEFALQCRRLIIIEVYTLQILTLLLVNPKSVPAGFN